MPELSGLTSSSSGKGSDAFGAVPGPESVASADPPELRQTLQDLREQLRATEQNLTRAQAELQLEEQENIASQASGAADAGKITIPIPAGWVPCTCPAQHPGAGVFVKGVQWHSPALRCQ
jgi:hypothetical protein